jgi:hypothetical protein
MKSGGGRKLGRSPAKIDAEPSTVSEIALNPTHAPEKRDSAKP